MRLRFASENKRQLDNIRVDREQHIIRDVVAMQIGRGQDSRNLGVDLTTLHQTMDMGNAKPNGILMRFGHPGSSENAMGYQVARATNFRVVGDRVIHDAQLILHASRSPVFEKDPLDYIMNMAEDNPQDIALSVVVDADEYWIMNDGTEIEYWDARRDDDLPKENGKPVNSLYDYPMLRLNKLYNVDFVMEGNLTPEGLHHKFATAMFDGSVHGDLMEMFTIGDDVRTRYDIPIEVVANKIVQVGNSYLRQIGSEERIQTMDPDKTATPVVPTDDTADAPPASELIAQSQIDTLQQQIENLQQAQTDELATVTRDEFDALQHELNQVKKQNQQLFSLMQQLVQGHSAVQQNQQALDNKLRVLNNERPVTETVTTQAPMNPMMQSAFDGVSQQTPQHFGQRGATDSARIHNNNPADGLNPEQYDDPMLSAFAGSQKRKLSQ